MTRSQAEVVVGLLGELEDPGCREFAIGDGDWPFRGFVVRKGEKVFAYQNFCVHVGHPLNWSPGKFLSKDKTALICASSQEWPAVHAIYGQLLAKTSSVVKLTPHHESGLGPRLQNLPSGTTMHEQVRLPRFRAKCSGRKKMHISLRAKSM